MNEIASPLQLRMSFLRWSLFFVPLILLLGFGAGEIAGAGADNRWFMALDKPNAQPPGWVFGVTWSIMYVLIGLAFTLIFCARGARLRAIALSLFTVHLALNLFWTPYFFGMHEVTNAFYLLVAIFILAFITTLVFGRIRALAAWLMVPYLAWLCFATILNKQFDELNPDAENLVVPSGSQTIALPPSE
jgi:benzodiazapine receptor